MKIAILTCIRSNDVCARVGCLRAFHDREAFFSDYGPDTELAALMTCNGCSRDNPLKPDEPAPRPRTMWSSPSRGMRRIR